MVKAHPFVGNSVNARSGRNLIEESPRIAGNGIRRMIIGKKEQNVGALGRVKAKQESEATGQISSKKHGGECGENSINRQGGRWTLKSNP